MNRQSSDGGDEHEAQYKDEYFVCSHTCPPMTPIAAHD